MCCARLCVDVVGVDVCSMYILCYVHRYMTKHVWNMGLEMVYRGLRLSDTRFHGRSCLIPKCGLSGYFAAEPREIRTIPLSVENGLLINRFVPVGLNIIGDFAWRDLLR